MSDKINKCTVGFVHDLSEEQFDQFKSALKLMGVALAVEPTIALPEDWLAYRRAKNDVAQKLYQVISSEG